MKYVKDFKIVDNRVISKDYFILDVQLNEKLGEILPGQFVEVLVDKSKNTFLRRPISIHNVDENKNIISMLIKKVGEGTETLAKYKLNDMLNIVYPLGNGFKLTSNKKVLLVGGGCGIAPLLYLAKKLKDNKNDIHILLGGRSKQDILEFEEFKKFGSVHISTDDGSFCNKGLVTQNPIIQEDFDMIYSCGPEPMLKAVAKIANQKNIECEVSLENTMACGIGACLCCVVDTKEGHLCVCTDGPVFNSNDLKDFQV